MKINDYFLGYGMGLRRSHYENVLDSSAKLPEWFEIVSENFMSFGGTPRKTLESLIDRKIPVVSHGVGLSLGSIDELNKSYISYLKELNDWLDVPWFSDHLCFSSSLNHQYHDLLPVLQTKESLELIVDKIKKIQDIFQKPFAFENISYYGASSHNTMRESDFINELLYKTDSFMLLDINNVYVNAKNHNFDPWKYLLELNLDKVIQLHLAGHFDRGDIIIDTHGESVSDEVWNLYEKFIAHIGREVSTLIEWDNNIPDYQEVLKLVDKASLIGKSALGK